MAAHALLIDFGSTYTKLRAVDMGACRVVAAGQGPSTVTSDVTIGMNAALADLEQRMGGLPEFRYRLASSSAAGGLRMVTAGLVKELTAEAARRAALGAGAKLVGAFAYRLTRTDIREIEALAPDIMLLCGGTDGGNADVIRHNAAALAASGITCPIIVAGNRSAADDVENLLTGAGKTAKVTGNVMPEFGTLDIEPARTAIRQTFIERIVEAKGIDRARAMFDRVLMPTPAAVLDGARLLSQGAGRFEGLGPLVVVDVGGATTDVHSIASGAPATPGTVPYGLPEPFAKRTVEGDLGVRRNAAAIVDMAGVAEIARDAGLTADAVGNALALVTSDAGRLPDTDAGRAFDEALARAAVGCAMRRHAGTVETVYTAHGPVAMQRGKDLSAVKALIGTGGPIVHAARPARILAAALAGAGDPASLRPRRPVLMLDADYALYAAGLLANAEPEAAFQLGLSALKPVFMEDEHGCSSAA